LWLNLFFRLEFVFLERLEGRRAGAQGIVFGDPVEDMDTAVMEQGWLWDGALGGGGANVAALEGPVADFLD